MCLCTFCTHGSGAFNKYVAKIHALCLENFCTSKSAIQKFWTFWVTGTHTKTNLRLHILYFGERTSDNHPSYLDYHVSSRLRQLCIYLRNIPHENPSSFSRSTFSALPCLEKKQVLSLPLHFG